MNFSALQSICAQGETIGYRARYLYYPCNQTVTAVDGSNDALGKLAEKLYQATLAQYPQNVCQN